MASELEVSTSHGPHEGSRHENEQDSKEVSITVDGQKIKIEAGSYMVAVFKKLVGVAADRELDIFENGTFQPLSDNSTIVIRKHEVFVSHVRTGGSS